MISFDIYDTYNLIEYRCYDLLSWESQTAFLRAIFETSRCMLATMNLTCSDNMEDGSIEKEIEIGIIRIRKRLKNMII
jgi:hypothetical protein